MQLSNQELLEVYEGVVKASGHPAPLSYMTRALLFSEGDPDYIGVDGKVGFMPVNPGDALEQVGAQEVQSLQSNIIATIAMERNLFTELGDIDQMIIAFHFGRDQLNADTTRGEPKELLDALPDLQRDTMALLYPPLATVSDVITMLKSSINTKKLSKRELEFFEFLVSRK